MKQETETMLEEHVVKHTFSCASPVPSGQAIRVLVVIPGSETGTSFLFMKRQMQSLERAGVEMRKIYLHSRTSLRYLLQARKLLMREVLEFRPQIIHSQYGTITSLLCCTFGGAPVLITFRGSDLNRNIGVGWLRGQLSTLFSQLSVLCASQIICVSRQLQSRLWWGKYKSIVLPTGVNLDLFCPMSMEEARAALGWNLVDKVVLFCGGSEPLAKGFSLVQEAVRLSENALGNIRLFCLDGTSAPDTVPLYLNAADCLAFASFNEGSPNIVKEALACNLPVVSVDVGDVHERLKGVSPSKIVRRDANEFGKALMDLLQIRKRSNGREKMLELSEEAVACKLVSIYRECSSHDI